MQKGEVTSCIRTCLGGRGPEDIYIYVYIYVYVYYIYIYIYIYTILHQRATHYCEVTRLTKDYHLISSFIRVPLKRNSYFILVDAFTYQRRLMAHSAPDVSLWRRISMDVYFFLDDELLLEFRGKSTEWPNEWCLLYDIKPFLRFTLRPIRLRVQGHSWFHSCFPVRSFFRFGTVFHFITLELLRSRQLKKCLEAILRRTLLISVRLLG